MRLRNCAAFEGDKRHTSDFLYQPINSPALKSRIFPGKIGVEDEGDMERLELESFEGRPAPDDAWVGHFDGVQAHFGVC